MRKKAGLIFHFYGNFGKVSQLISIIWAVVISLMGMTSLMAIFITKILCTAAIVYIAHNFVAKQYPYYRNLGLNPLQLWSWSLVLDFVLFFIILLAGYIIWSIR